MPTSDVQFTVLLATRNGGQVLRKTLAGYCDVIRPACGWKIVIVDNGSTDSTPDVIEYFSRHLRIERIPQPVPGKSRSLNAGLKAVEGEFAIFTDDDAVPNVYFLESWIEALKTRTEYGLFGGSIELAFDSSPPTWIRKSALSLAFLYGERDLPEGPTRWDEIFGANMAVRTSVLAQGFQFDERIGPDEFDPGYRLGEDSDFCRRITEAGVACWFAKGAVVQHIVRPHQFSQASISKRAYQGGKGRAYLSLRRGGPGVPPSVSWTDRLKMLSPLPQHRCESWFRYHYARGFRDECLRATTTHGGSR
jgi:glycosyltransferase involved in cell wall biosynthesis